jgi:hypothetical protein
MQSKKFDAETINLFNKMIRMRKERGLDNESFNKMIQKLFKKEIQLIKNQHPTFEDLRERNIQRLCALKEQKRVYCPMYQLQIENVGTCHFCSYGHMTECHYPYTCDSRYCQHYAEQELTGGS